jgi:putative RecB family exonuclease
MEQKVVRLSPSRVNDFTNCPRLYKYRAIENLPEKLSLDAERGKLVHSVLEDLFDLPRNERKESAAIELLPTKWEEHQVEKPEITSAVPDEKEWLDRVKSLLSTYFLLEDPTTFDSTYRELHLERDMSEEVYLHGYVDRLDIAATGEVRIIDYKTGKSPKPGWEEKALFQLRVYALLYWRREGVIPRLLQLLYLGDGKSVKSSPTESQLLATERILTNISQEILTAIETDHFPAKKSRLCDWCSFKEICPAFNKE